MEQSNPIVSVTFAENGGDRKFVLEIGLWTNDKLPYRVMLKDLQSVITRYLAGEDIPHIQFTFEIANSDLESFSSPINDRELYQRNKLYAEIEASDKLDREIEFIRQQLKDSCYDEAIGAIRALEIENRLHSNKQ